MMPLPAAECPFAEGKIILRESCQNRTVNAFPDPAAPVFNVSRDAPNDAETLSAYIER